LDEVGEGKQLQPTAGLPKDRTGLIRN